MQTYEIVLGAQLKKIANVFKHPVRVDTYVARLRDCTYLLVSEFRDNSCRDLYITADKRNRVSLIIIIYPDYTAPYRNHRNNEH